MSILNTTFAGLSLRNPIIISSSGLTDSADKVKKLEFHGAGAVVLKSIFEEQILMQSGDMATYDYPEAEDYIKTYVRSHALSEYIKLIKECKSVCKIPIIASINCYNKGEWAEFAKTVQEAGADALELNIMSIETSKEYKYGEMEQRYIDILSDVKKHISIPIIVKLSSNLSNPIALINQLYANGAEGVVMFNRFYQTDININTLEFTTGDVFSNGSELSNSLRWTSIASSEVPNQDIAISGGVNSASGVIKSILVGASAVEVCSVIYKKGVDEIDKMTEDLTSWMASKGYNSISQFKGLMNLKVEDNANPFERTQFMKYFSSK